MVKWTGSRLLFNARVYDSASDLEQFVTKDFEQKMNKFNLILGITFSLYFGSLYADDHVISYGMEGYQCNYKEGVNFDDLVSFMKDDLNPYADENWSVPYSGFYLTPCLLYTSPSPRDAQ